MEKVSMLDCICRVPSVLDTILENREATFSQLLKVYGERLAQMDELVFVGSGTSNTASITARFFAERASGLRVSVAPPSEFLYCQTYRNQNALHVFISQTGNSILTCKALDLAKSHGLMNAVVSEACDTNAAKLADVFINMRCGKEEYPMRTIGYSATVLTLMLLGVQMGHSRGFLSAEKRDEYHKDAQAAAAHIRPVIDQAMMWLDKNRRSMLRCDGLFLYGSGALYGVALEGAVKIWETPQIISVGYELEEGIHGPNYGFNHRHCVVVLNDGGTEDRKAVALAKYMKNEKENGFIVGKSPINETDLSFEPVGKDFCCLQFAAVVQVMAYRLAVEQGRDLFAPHDNRVMEGYFKSHDW
jgi:glucosamine 6-phosphate synthetase-like amidotransferase/phosphosugar isomerase protein